MSTVLEPSLLRTPRGRWWPWGIALLGLAFLFVPTWADLSRGAWRDDAYAHGPLILALVAWMLWRERAVLVDGDAAPAPGRAALLLVPGLALWLLGRTMGLPLFEVAAELPLLAGTIVLLRGPSALRRLAFPVLFLFFVIPLPGFILDTATGPLKTLVSAMVEGLLRLLDYPVWRTGVVLGVGGHEMLVADACSGLNSLASLFALTLFYLHATGPSSRARAAILLLAIVPIAIVANVLRVLVLVLATVHLGEEAAQGLLHTVAGMLVFVTALGSIMVLDGFVRRRWPARVPAEAARPDTPAPRAVRSSLMPWAAVAAIAMAGTALAAPMLRPVASAEAPDLEAMVPAAFGDWRIDPEIVPVPPTPDVQAKLDRLYRQVLARTYVNSRGERIMLTIAHGGDQGDALKAHRQEACYAAQGFEIRGLEHARLALPRRDIPITRFQATLGERAEPVTYWFTMGDRVVLGRLERLGAQLRAGFAGKVPDGLLVRVSSLSREPAAAYAVQAAFVAALVGPLDEASATRLAGTPESP